MGLENKINKRMSEAVVQSYFKPWYRRVWGKIILVWLAIVILALIAFGIKLINATVHMNKGEIYEPALGVWVTEEQYFINLKLAADALSDDDPWLGAEAPLVNIIAYESFGCPFCKADQKNIQEMLATFSPVVRFTTRDFATEGLHEGALDAHLAAACANEQGRYWEYHDLLYLNQGEFAKSNLKFLAKDLGLNIQQFDECLDSDKFIQEVRQDYASGVDAGVQGTPSFVVNGTLLEGSMPYEVWSEIIGFLIKGDF